MSASSYRSRKCTLPFPWMCNMSESDVPLKVKMRPKANFIPSHSIQTNKERINGDASKPGPIIQCRSVVSEHNVRCSFPLPLLPRVSLIQML